MPLLTFSSINFKKIKALSSNSVPSKHEIASITSRSHESPHMYALRLPKDLRDKEKVYQRKRAGEAYVAADPGILIGALWAQHGRLRPQQRSVTSAQTLSAIRSSTEDADAHPFISDPSVLKASPHLCRDVLLRCLLSWSSSRTVCDRLRVQRTKECRKQAQEEARQRELIRLHAERARLDAAATTIQSHVRGHRTRMYPRLAPLTTTVKVENERDEAATKIQSVFRMSQTRKLFLSRLDTRAKDRAFLRLTMAATMLQRWWRQFYR